MKDSDKVILHLCADIGSDTWKYKQAGYHVLLVGKNIGVENYTPSKDVRTTVLDNNGNYKILPIYGVIANPVCTEFSIATGFDKKRNYEKGMFLVNHCLRIIEECGKDSLKFWVIENPASGHLKDFIGKPNYVYEPWWYGDPWTKKTALWGKFNIPRLKYRRWVDVPKNPNLYVRPTRNKPSMAFLHKSAKEHIDSFKEFSVETDSDFRSLCPQGFAKAFFEENR